MAVIRQLDDHRYEKEVVFPPIVTEAPAGGFADEDILYVHLLEHSPFTKVYYDVFSEPNTVTLAGTPIPTYNSTNSLYVVDNGSVIETGELIDAGDTNTYYRFSIHIETTSICIVEYSVDGGNTWASCSFDKINIHLVGFTSIKFRFAFTSSGVVNSYGFLYNYQPVSTTSDIRLFEVVTITSDHLAPYQMQIPYGQIYTNDGKSLEVYLNRVRLIPGVDYVEIDDRTLEFQVDLVNGDTLMFIEKYGEVDVSIENWNRMNVEHELDGHHVFVDRTTGIKYRLFVDNGQIQLEPV